MIDRLLPSFLGDLDDERLLDAYSPGAPEWLRVNFVSSADGAATGGDGLSAGLGDEADARVFALLRRLADVVLVGAGTVRAEGYGAMRLPEPDAAWREAHGLAPHPVFAIVSGALDLDPASPIFVDAPVPPIVITAPGGVFAGEADVIDTLDLAAAVAALRSRGLARVHCEGGPRLFGSLLEAGLVDELCLTVSPLLQGGDARRIVAGGLGHPVPLELAHVLSSGSTLLLRYLVRH